MRRLQRQENCRERLKGLFSLFLYVVRRIYVYYYKEEQRVDFIFYLIFIIIAMPFAICTVIVFISYSRLNKILNRAHEMTATATGVISSVTTVYRRNQSFRWRNEYPTITFHAEGIDVCIEAKYAEKSKGTYALGESYQICYVPGEPACCIIEEFRTKMQRSRKNKRIGFIILLILTFNLLSTTIMGMLGIEWKN